MTLCQKLVDDLRWGSPIPDGELARAKHMARDFLSRTLVWTSPASQSETKALLRALSEHRVFQPSKLSDPNLARAATVQKWTEYLNDLAGFPKWVVQKACDRARHEDGDTHHRFFPTSGHLLALCNEIYDPFQRQIAQANRVLDYRNPEPDKQSPEGREAEKAAVQAIVDRLNRRIG